MSMVLAGRRVIRVGRDDSVNVLVAVRKSSARFCARRNDLIIGSGVETDTSLDIYPCCKRLAFTLDSDLRSAHPG